MNPNSWFVVFSFCAIATLLSAGYGWSVVGGKLPLNPAMNYSDAQLDFIKVWAKVAGIIGIVFPVVIWIVFWDNPVARSFLSCYLLVVAVQLTSEIGFSRAFCKSTVVIIGTLYTGFRIWQLWSGLHSIAYPRFGFALLWLVFAFWVANMLMLIILAIPSISPKSSDCNSSGEEKVN